MKIKLHDYIKSLDEGTEKIDINYILFFQHERLVHLIITMFFALFSLMFIFKSIDSDNYLLYAISFLLIIVLLFYILHYFYLENSVQYLYKLYDKMNSKIK